MIVFVSNYFNHHQKPFSDEMANLLNGDYRFIATSKMPEFRKKLGYRDLSRSYVINYSEKNKESINELINTADVVIFSANKLGYVKERIRAGKITIIASERRYKQIKNYLKLPIHLYQSHLYNKCYLLCASAFAASDYHKSFMPYKRCLKWAYFTEVKDIDIDQILLSKRHEKVRLMWCARFIGWKHPEMAIKLASKLKASGYEFELNMYGNGPLLDKIQKSISDEQLVDCVFIKGNAPNEDIIKAMQSHNIFLFTSDQNEGWGAVANEAMSNGCTIVGSNKIGSIPYLIRHKKNGLVFNSEDIESLYNQVSSIMDNRKLCEDLAREAYISMIREWNPKNAADRLLHFVDNLKQGKETPYTEGPCSCAITLYKRQ